MARPRVAIARVDPGANTVAVLSIPRDLWVDLPGHGEGRINSAMSTGPGLLIETVREMLGIELNHYAELDFAGAVALGNAVGGLAFDFEHPSRDRLTGLDVREPGCQTLDGMQSLALARSRHLEVEVAPGTWQRDETSDFGRMARQQQVALAGLAAFSRLEPADPTGAAAFLDAVAGHLVVDGATGRDDLVRMFRDIAGSRVRSIWLPVEEWTTPSGHAVLVPVSDGRFEATIERFVAGADVGSADTPGPEALPEFLEGAIVPKPC